MVSRDIIVLAKLVRTLCPLKLVLFGTAHARDSGWTSAAAGMLETLNATRPDILGSFQVVDLPNSTLPEAIDFFRASIIEAVVRVSERKGPVAFDCTTGPSIYHVLGFDTIRAIGVLRGFEVSAFYVDADTGTILRSTVHGDVISYDHQPTTFRYQHGNELSERFGMYGVLATRAVRLWPEAVDLERQQELCDLYDALCNDRSLRAVFHSYWFKLGRWNSRKIATGAGAAVDFPSLLDRGINHLADWAYRKTGRLEHAAMVRKSFTRAVSDIVPRASNGDWLDHYRTDKKLSSLRHRLQDEKVSLAKKMFLGRRDGKRREEFIESFSPELRSFLKELKCGLERLNQSAGNAASSFSAEEQQAWREDELSALSLPESLKKLLFSEMKLADLFEACVGAALARIVDKCFRDSVAVVWQNVEFAVPGRSIAELDTLVLFSNADISVLEAKTHHGNADLKKIEANIKGLRDFGGAHSRYNLVYPLTSGELAELEEAEGTDLQKWDALDMEDAFFWGKYLRMVRRTRDQRIIGLDELRDVLLQR